MDAMEAGRGPEDLMVRVLEASVALDMVSDSVRL